MSHVPARVGSAEKDVLHQLIRLRQWSTSDGALYESRAFTEQLFQRLVTRGFVSENMKESPVVYRPTAAGLKWAQSHPPRY